MFLMAGPTGAFGQNDAQGCRDHPLITRMPNFYIRLCEGSEFDRYEFSSESGPIAVEGKKRVLYYSLKDGATAPSVVAVVRNHINALKKIGGTVVYDGGSRATLKVTRGKQEIWVGVDAAAAYEYILAVVEKGEMQQDIVATAEGMTKEIAATGRVALYGIYFDTGKTGIGPESESSLKEIAEMLKQNGTMKLFVVGHTDNAGGIGANLVLSKARAESVVKELTAKYGVKGTQLAAYGVGSLSPVAPNATEEGRALNRRVELVAQ
jgi:outer membrane protein OmpA-like peptidoglycan-associated protein